MPMNENGRSCLNCDVALSKENFCPNCGQSTGHKRITFRETLGDFIGHTLSLDGAFLKTHAALVTRPGALFRDYLKGKRQNYYKPVPFFIVNTAIYLLVATLIGYDALKGTKIALTVGGEVTAVALTTQAGQFMASHINHILFFLVISIGLLSKLYFWKRYNLAEYVAVAFFIAAGYTAIGIPTMLLSHYVSPALKYLAFAALILYVIVAYPFFFKDRGITVWLRSILLAFTSIIFYIVIGFSFSFLVVWLRAKF